MEHRRKLDNLAFSVVAYIFLAGYLGMVVGGFVLFVSLLVN